LRPVLDPDLPVDVLLDKGKGPAGPPVHVDPADVKAMMNIMLGFAAGALACAGPRSADAASKNPATIAPSLSHLRCRCFICHLLVDECDGALRHVPKVEVIVVEG
jgi:hypothetical protein